VQSLVKEFYSNSKIVAAICAAPMALDAAGVLQGKSCTAYPGVHLSNCDGKQISDIAQPVVVDGNVVTSRGPGTAFHFGLEIVRILQGSEEADAVKKAILVG
jgi:putative intracellular protease/amidase